MGLFSFRCAPLGSAIPLHSTPAHWSAFLPIGSWMISVTGLPGLLEESSCLPQPWGPIYHLPLQTDVGQCWIIFNAVLFPLDSSGAPSPPPLFSFLPPPLLIHSETDKADVSALFLAPVIVTAFSSAHFINSFCDGGVR